MTPPAGLWILSAENFYFGAFYMLSQLGINLEGQGGVSIGIGFEGSCLLVSVATYCSAKLKAIRAVAGTVGSGTSTF